MLYIYISRNKCVAVSSGCTVSNCTIFIKLPCKIKKPVRIFLEAQMNIEKEIPAGY